MSSIQLVSKEKQPEELWDLGITVYNQDELEEGVMAQVDSAIKKQELEKLKKVVEKDLEALAEEIRSVKSRLSQIDQALSMAPKKDVMSKDAKRQIESINREKENKVKQLKRLKVKKRSLLASIGQAMENEPIDEPVASSQLEHETRFQLQKVFSAESGTDLLVRSGEMTPFGAAAALKKASSVKLSTGKQLTDFEQYLLDSGSQKKKAVFSKNPTKTKPNFSINQNKSEKETIKSRIKDQPKTFPVIDVNQPSTSKSITCFVQSPPKKKLKTKLGSKFALGIPLPQRSHHKDLNYNYKSDGELSDFENGNVNYDDDHKRRKPSSDDEYIPDCSEESDTQCNSVKGCRKAAACDDDSEGWISVEEEKRRKIPKKIRQNLKNRVVDDGNEKVFSQRIKEYKYLCALEEQERLHSSQDESEKEKFFHLDDCFKISFDIWEKLFRYQQTGVKWLWELHQQNSGGIIGDEMGLGKTIQVIAFLSGLQVSSTQTDGDIFTGLGPVILVCPATVMHQWVKEFHKWWPPVRVAVLHDSGSYAGKKRTLIKYINQTNGIIITSYAGITAYQNDLLGHEWHYIILDEGHKIRNPDAKVTLACKQFRTPHRLILSGSPVQNNLKELWSLFDFVFPGKLGTLPIFMQEFSVPIVQGGYANASEVQVETAYKCAVVLRNTIKPYLLRRMKSDVQMSLQLPDKSEQVLFCKLTEEQRSLYKSYLETADISGILDGRCQIFVGLIKLRQICNHPDIYSGGPKIFKNTDIDSLKDSDKFGYYKKSGKMLVVSSLLQLWKKQGHRVLLFTQSRQMLKIFATFMTREGYSFLTMDGTTNIASRQPAINKFNNDPSIFVFVLTTKVGGLGVNLTGANRIIIYDPDWNPSTDIQSRERAWRIGQTKQVTIYRLLTAGTIEEKIYHRQIFKLFLTNRVLKDPRQRRFFKTNDLHELFTLGEDTEKGNETSAIFAGTGSEVKLKKRKESKEKKSDVAIRLDRMKEEFSFSSKKIDKMKEMAKLLSQKLVAGEVNNPVKKLTETENQEKEETSTIEMSIKREKSPKKRKRKELDGIEFEGKKIKNLLKQDVFKLSQEITNNEDMKQDEYILKKLFQKSSVQTALKHDTIMDCANPDYMLVEGEANRVANEAVKALKRSRRQCQLTGVGIPTWTGANGISGMPNTLRKRFGQKKNSKVLEITAEKKLLQPIKPLVVKRKALLPPPVSLIYSDSEEKNPVSSSDLLSIMRKRNPSPVPRNDDDSMEEIPSMSENVTEYDELLRDIQNFVAFQSNVNGEATTEEILEAFKEKVPTNAAPIFKALLGKICDFHRVQDKVGIWKLKMKFR